MSSARPDSQVARNFGRAARNYDDSAVVQREVREHLARLARRSTAALPSGPLLDAGCGTGEWHAALSGMFPGRSVFALDLAAPMLHQARQLDSAIPCLQADIHALPLAARTLAGIWSSMTLQWCEPAHALAEFARCLRPDGVAWIATLGPRTFHELRSAFADIDDADHVLDCPPAGAWQRAAAAAGFELVDEDRREFVALAPDLRQLLRDIKAIGARGVGPGRRRAMLGKRAWQTVVERYEGFRRPDGKLGASYDGIFLVLRRME